LHEQEKTVRSIDMKGAATALALGAVAASARAHEGHGASGAHAHGFDVVIGVVGVLLAAGLWLWLRNKR
jgi:hypothetical protein